MLSDDPVAVTSPSIVAVPLVYRHTWAAITGALTDTVLDVNVRISEVTGWPTLMSSAVTVRLPPPVLVPLVWKLTVSESLSPLMVTEAAKLESRPSTLMVSSPDPALIVRDDVGLAKVTASAKVESILDIPFPAVPSSDRVMVSAPPVNEKTRSAITVESMIGSRPV